MPGTGGQLYVNGGKLFTEWWDANIGSVSGASNNLVQVSSGGLWGLGGGYFNVGNAAGANGNVLHIDGAGSVVTNITIFGVGRNGGNSNSVVISSGGQLFVHSSLGANSTKIGWSGEVGNQILVNNGTYTDTGPVLVGVGNGSGLGGGNQLTVTNGGVVIAAQLGIGRLYDSGNGSGSSNNIVTVAGANAGGSNATINLSGRICIGGAGGGDYNQLVIGRGGQVVALRLDCAGWVGVGSNNVALVHDGGLLELNNTGDTLITQGSSGNTISNVGGIYQFTYAAPTLYTTGGGPITITDGTISFRGVTNANVNGNLGGATTLGGMTFNGANTFRLNSASNTTASSQTYTFGTGLGAKNYARLELLNGSCYQGGAVTNGNGGSLVVSNGTSTISSNLTFVAGSSLTVCVGTNAVGGTLNAGGTLALNGATLNLSLGHVPVGNEAYVIVTNPGTAPVGGMGTFAANTVNVGFGGKTYRMSVRYNAGDGNDISVTYVALTGALLMFQ